MLAPLGQVIWFGSIGGDLPADMASRFNRHFMKGISMRSFHLGSTPRPTPWRSSTPWSRSSVT